MRQLVLAVCYEIGDVRKEKLFDPETPICMILNWAAEYDVSHLSVHAIEDIDRECCRDMPGVNE